MSLKYEQRRSTHSLNHTNEIKDTHIYFSENVKIISWKSLPFHEYVI